MEIAELPGHPWYVAVQFHPEFKSKPTRPHPLFAAFVAAAYQHKTERSPRDADACAQHRAARVNRLDRRDGQEGLDGTISRDCPAYLPIRPILPVAAIPAPIMSL